MWRRIMEIFLIRKNHGIEVMIDLFVWGQMWSFCKSNKDKIDISNNITWLQWRFIGGPLWKKITKKYAMLITIVINITITKSNQTSHIW